MSTLKTAAFQNGKDAAGAKYVKPGLTESPERDLELALGWPQVAYFVEGHPDGKLQGEALRKVLLDPLDAVPVEWASRRIRAMSAFMCDPSGNWRDGAIAAFEDKTPFTPESAARFIRDDLASKKESMGVLKMAYAELEAMFGPDLVLGAMVDALEKAGPKRVGGDDRKLLALAASIGPMLLRVRASEAPKLRARLKKLVDAVKDPDSGYAAMAVGRLLAGPKADKASLPDIALWSDATPGEVTKAIGTLSLDRYSMSVQPRLVLLAGDAAVALYEKSFSLLKEGRAQRQLVEQFGCLRTPAIPGLMKVLAEKSKAAKLATAWLEAHKPGRAAKAASPKAEKPVKAGVVLKLDPAKLLEQFDAAVLGNDWPDFFELNPEDRFHGMRVVVARSGVDWGVVFERLQGCDSESVEVKRWRFGSQVKWGIDSDGDGLISFSFEGDDDGDAAKHDIDGLELTGPRGPLTLKKAMVKGYDLGKCRSRWDTAFRAYHAHFPDGFWPDTATGLRRLGMKAPVLLVCSDAYAHVPLNRKKQVLPSKAPAMQSLSKAIAEGDAKLFKPGKPNTDWRDQLG